MGGFLKCLWKIEENCAEAEKAVDLCSLESELSDFSEDNDSNDDHEVTQAGKIIFIQCYPKVKQKWLPNAFLEMRTQASLLDVNKDQLFNTIGKEIKKKYPVKKTAKSTVKRQKRIYVKRKKSRARVSTSSDSSVSSKEQHETHEVLAVCSDSEHSVAENLDGDNLVVIEETQSNSIEVLKEAAIPIELHDDTSSSSQADDIILLENCVSGLESVNTAEREEEINSSVLSESLLCSKQKMNKSAGKDKVQEEAASGVDNVHSLELDQKEAYSNDTHEKHQYDSVIVNLDGSQLDVVSGLVGQNMIERRPSNGSEVEHLEGNAAPLFKVPKCKKKSQVDDISVLENTISDLESENTAERDEEISSSALSDSLLSSKQKNKNKRKLKVQEVAESGADNVHSAKMDQFSESQTTEIMLTRSKMKRQDNDRMEATHLKDNSGTEILSNETCEAPESEQSEHIQTSKKNSGLKSVKKKKKNGSEESQYESVDISLDVNPVSQFDNVTDGSTTQETVEERPSDVLEHKQAELNDAEHSDSVQCAENLHEDHLSIIEDRQRNSVEAVTEQAVEHEDDLHDKSSSLLPPQEGDICLQMDSDFGSEDLFGPLNTQTIKNSQINKAPSITANTEESDQDSDVTQIETEVSIFGPGTPRWWDGDRHTYEDNDSGETQIQTPREKKKSHKVKNRVTAEEQREASVLHLEETSDNLAESVVDNSAITKVKKKKKKKSKLQDHEDVESSVENQLAETVQFSEAQTDELTSKISKKRKRKDKERTKMAHAEENRARDIPSNETFDSDGAAELRPNDQTSEVPETIYDSMTHVTTSKPVKKKKKKKKIRDETEEPEYDLHVSSRSQFDHVDEVVEQQVIEERLIDYNAADNLEGNTPLTAKSAKHKKKGKNASSSDDIIGLEKQASGSESGEAVLEKKSKKKHKIKEQKNAELASDLGGNVHFFQQSESSTTDSLSRKTKKKRANKDKERTIESMSNELFNQMQTEEITRCSSPSVEESKLSSVKKKKKKKDTSEKHKYDSGDVNLDASQFDVVSGLMEQKMVERRPSNGSEVEHLESNAEPLFKVPKRKKKSQNASSPFQVDYVGGLENAVSDLESENTAKCVEETNSSVVSDSLLTSQRKKKKKHKLKVQEEAESGADDLHSVEMDQFNELQNIEVTLKKTKKKRKKTKHLEDNSGTEILSNETCDALETEQPEHIQISEEISGLKSVKKKKKKKNEKEESGFALDVNSVSPFYNVTDRSTIQETVEEGPSDVLEHTQAEVNSTKHKKKRKRSSLPGSSDAQMQEIVAPERKKKKRNSDHITNAGGTFVEGSDRTVLFEESHSPVLESLESTTKKSKKKKKKNKEMNESIIA